MAERFDRAFWDDRYRSRSALWSGSPNRHLMAEAEDLVPGTALDVGAGEGADAIWLAGRGWRATAVDISGVALERAARTPRRQATTSPGASRGSSETSPHGNRRRGSTTWSVRSTCTSPRPSGCPCSRVSRTRSSRAALSSSWRTIPRTFTPPPVSYTHLDVYKRQPWPMLWAAPRNPRRAGCSESLVRTHS